MIYLATASSARIRAEMSAGRLGQLVTPRSGDAVAPGAIWALDNGCFSARWNAKQWRRGLDRYANIPGCLFAVVPDVVGDARATDLLWARYVPIVRDAGFVPAYVSQNGCETVPPDAGALFTGGDDEWKMGADAQRLVDDARSRGLWCHMGRVNSWRRIRYATRCGYDSVDGTYLAFGPDKNLPNVLRWIHRANTERTLF